MLHYIQKADLIKHFLKILNVELWFFLFKIKTYYMISYIFIAYTLFHNYTNVYNI